MNLKYTIITISCFLGFILALGYLHFEKTAPSKIYFPRYVLINPNIALVSLKEAPCTSVISKNFKNNNLKQAVTLRTGTKLLINGCWRVVGDDYQIFWEDGTIDIRDKLLFKTYTEFYIK